MIWLAVISAFILVLALLAAQDLIQRQHAIRRNFPLIGRLRYLLEAIGPELRQYIVTSNNSELPLSRNRCAPSPPLQRRRHLAQHPLHRRADLLGVEVARQLASHARHFPPRSIDRTGDDFPVADECVQAQSNPVGDHLACAHLTRYVQTQRASGQGVVGFHRCQHGSDGELWRLSFCP
jgi:hypothetical protein